DADKAVVGRIGYDPAKWLHLSASAMRTGDLDVQKDQFSELWFGGGFIRQLGAPATTTKFQVELLEGDAQFLWPRGHLKSAGGWLRFDDNDPTTDHRRHVHYYYLEGRERQVLWRGTLEPGFRSGRFSARRRRRLWPAFIWQPNR